MKSKRTKACDISPAVRQAVLERDGGMSVISGMPGTGNAHYIARSLGGLGIVENIVTLTPEEHHEYDNGSKHKEYKELIKAYLDSKYPGFSDEDRKFNKWRCG